MSINVKNIRLKRKKLLLNIVNIFVTTLLVISAIGLYLSAKASIENEGGRLIFISEPKQTSLKKQYVQIAGEVQKPGIYEIREGMRVFEVIEMAEGIKPGVKLDIGNLNLVREVKDGEVIIISDKTNETSEDTISKYENFSPKININTADIQELTMLPGIGIATAEKIISARPFNNLSDIMKISGIGQEKYSQIMHLIEI